jgi:hypothetical protein
VRSQPLSGPRQISHVGTVLSVTRRDRDYPHQAVRHAATAQVTVTADQDSVRTANVNSSAHLALPNRVHRALLYITDAHPRYGPMRPSRK